MSEPYYAIVIPVVVPDAHCDKLLTNLLTSISWGKYDCPVIVCWDNVAPETIAKFEKDFPFITSIPYIGAQNLNFAKNANRGLKYAHDKGLGAFCVNMDTVLPHRAHLEKIINSGISSPKSTHIDGEVALKTYKLNQMAEPGCPCNKTLDINKGTPSNKFAAFCMWISKYAFAKIGYLDDKTFTASFEDDDYCVRACLAGLPCEEYNIPVHHELKNREVQISTTNAYNLNQLMDHLNKFMQKWRIPPGVAHADFAKYILMFNQWNDSFKIDQIQVPYEQ